MIDIDLHILNNLCLDEVITISKYILDFITCKLKLTQLKYVIPLATLCSKLLNQIKDPNYITAVQTLQGKDSQVDLI